MVNRWLPMVSRWLRRLDWEYLWQHRRQGRRMILSASASSINKEVIRSRLTAHKDRASVLAGRMAFVRNRPVIGPITLVAITPVTWTQTARFPLPGTVFPWGSRT